MDFNANAKRPDGVTIEYRMIGTMRIEEFMHAVIEDLIYLRDHNNVRFVRGARLKLPATDERGELIKVRRPEGGTLHRMDTIHYRAAYLDYYL